MNRSATAMVLVLLLAFGSFGCTRPNAKTGIGTQKSTRPTSTTLSVSEYFPKTDGSKWEFEGSGNEFAAFTRTVVYSSGNRVQMTDNNGGTTVARVFQLEPNRVTLVYELPESYTPVNLLAENPVLDETILKAPLAKGTLLKRGTQTWTLISSQETVKTPAGVFQHCIVVENKGPNGSVREYYAPNTGLIKRTFDDPATKANVTSSLKRYTQGP